MKGFDLLRKKINKIADNILAIDGAYPVWSYGDLMQLIDSVESECYPQPDCTDCIKNGGDYECDRVHCRKGNPPKSTPSGWVCPVCGRGLSPSTTVYPCQNGKGGRSHVR